MIVQFKLSTLLMASIMVSVALGLAIHAGISVEVLAILAGFLIAAVALGGFLKFGKPTVSDGLLAAGVVVIFILLNVYCKSVSNASVLMIGSPGIAHYRKITVGFPLGYYSYDALGNIADDDGLQLGR